MSAQATHNRWPHSMGSLALCRPTVTVAMITLLACLVAPNFAKRGWMHGSVSDSKLQAYANSRHPHRRLLESDCPLPEVDMTKDKYDCVVWRKACLEQNVIVSYDPDVHPTTSMEDLPTLDLSDLSYNIPSKYGIGDRFVRGSSLQQPALYVRASNDMEEAPDLQVPTFSKCTLPLLVYANYPFNAAETFRYLFEKLVTLQQDGFFNRHVTLVPGVPSGTRVPSYTKLWLGSLSDRGVMSLSQLSSRRRPNRPSNATWEGRHIRCFERVVGCKIKYDGYGLQFYNAGQHVVKHYLPQILRRSVDFEQRLYDRAQVRLPDDPSVLKLVFVSRTPHQSAVGRTILNEKELIQQCNNAAGADLPPPEWGVPYKKFFCFAHIFGEDQLMDVWLMRRVDGIFGMHGAGLINAFYMKPGGSLVEVRPLGFNGMNSWVDHYMRFMANSPNEQPPNVFWYGVETYNASLSEPSVFEKEPKLHYTKNSKLLGRDRHVRVTWASLRHQLLNMAAVARTVDRYTPLVQSGVFYVTDDLKQVEPASQDPGHQQRNFTDPDAERLMLAKVPLSFAHLQFAAAPDTR